MNLNFTYINQPENQYEWIYSKDQKLFEHFQSRNVVNDYDQIMPNLHIGNETSGRKYGNQFQLVVNCTPDVPFHSECKDKIRIPVDDTPKLADKMYNLILRTRVLDEMHNTLQNKKSVLVHCHQGIQRSCAITACYLVKYHNMTPNQAIEYIKSKRNVAFYYGANFKKTIDTVYNDKMNRYY
jgi:hypothetical protein